MSALKIKDAQGNWIEVPMIRGKQGDKGDKGDTYTLTEQDKEDIAELVNSFEIHICSSAEYDSTTRVPTIQNPDEKTFYLVPSEDGASPDLFVEWAYVNNAWEMFGSASIDLSGYLTDVQVNGTSVVTDGVANVPLIGYGQLGIAKLTANSNLGGLAKDGTGTIYVDRATEEIIKQGENRFRPIAPQFQHTSAFYGLAKVAGHDEKDSALTVGNYTPEAKGAIQSMLGIDSLIAPTETNPFTEAHAIGDLFIINGALYRAKTAIAVGDVLDDGVNVEGVNSSDVYVKNTDIAGDNYGVIKVKAGDHGLTKASNGYLQIYSATSNDIKGGSQSYRPVAPNRQNEAVFYGLAKASGDTTQSASSNAVGTYTDDAKVSIQTMLGVPSSDDVVSDVQINGTSVVTDGVASIPIASATVLGVLKPDNGSLAINTNNVGQLIIRDRPLAYYKGANPNTAVVCSSQHIATFYGLAKASGDTTQSQSDNAVGTYTDEAKQSIKQMLGVVDSYDSLVVNVTGTDPVITGSPSYRYNCGEVASLTVTPPSSGTIDIIFTSGTTPTVLDLPSTVKMPSWWIGVEANTTYEMCITDGVYCGVMSWDA